MTMLGYLPAAPSMTCASGGIHLVRLDDAIALDGAWALDGVDYEAGSMSAATVTGSSMRSI